jgi:hypothetical protein
VNTRKKLQKVKTEISSVTSISVVFSGQKKIESIISERFLKETVMNF